MAYTTSQAITTLNEYLGISEKDKEIIPNTKDRGFMLTSEGEKIVIFVYPLVHKQDNTKNYFDTRDSGALERGIAWNYAAANKLKYFCLGVNDSVPKYADYTFSLECGEQVIETLSGTKNGVRNGKGNQIIIPNDYVPQKDFERIKNRLGTYIAVIKRTKLWDYLKTYDNRPYLLDPSEIDLSGRLMVDNYKELDLSGRRKMFTEWMGKAKKPDGSPYAESIVNGYSVVLETYPKRLEGITLENTNLYYYWDSNTFPEIVQTVKSAENFAEIDKKAFSGGLSAAMSKYAEFLNEINSKSIEEDDKTDTTETVDIMKNCLEVQRNPRTAIIHPLNFIIYGAPGTGKTYSTAEYALAIIENRVADIRKKTAAERKAVMAKYNDYVKKGQIVFTTFHQSYGYEEFIQGLRPDTENAGMSFKTIDGTFKKIADTALIDPDNNYVIIIDEINRANISKVFGELITLIEEDKRWGEINETCATLQSGDIFAVPNNLYIVGTMNSADKSISLIDAALRRRFSFIEQQPDDSLVEDSVLRKVLHEMNLILAKELDSTDLLVGHSYFMNKTADNICDILNNSIIPLLYEYFYDNRKKVANILNDVIKKSGASIELEDQVIGRLRVKTKDGADDSEQV